MSIIFSTKKKICGDKMFKYEELFDSKNISPDRGVNKYRVKTIKSGPILECEIYPIYNRTYVRGLKIEKTGEAQRKLNIKNRRKKIIRLINTNFTKKDLWVTLTYDKEHNPKTEQEAQRNIRNYLRKIRYRDKNVKYIYVTEGKVKNKRFHHHVVISTKLDRDEIENLWQGGARKEAHRLQPDEFNLTGLGMYMTKSIEKKSQWGKSNNLKKPKETISDTKITKRQARKIAQNENEAFGIFEKLYRGYKSLKIDWFSSEIINGVYIRATMRKRL